MNQIYGGGVFREAADVDGEEARKKDGDEGREGHGGLAAEEAVVSGTWMATEPPRLKTLNK
ncbi:hypothetical protein ACSBR2_035887 [Camellia fascicularis]